MLQGFAPLRPRGRPGRLRERRRLPQVLSLSQVEAILRAQRHLRDRLLFALLFQTGMRVGQALGMRHEDVVTWENRIEIVSREDNANGARGKGGEGSVPVGAELMRLYAHYMHVEYGSLDSDYVFVNLFAQPYGRPLRYQAVHQLVRRLRKDTGIGFTLHMLRHSRATDLLRHGVGVDVVARLLTHRSSTTTSQTYIHLDVDDLRAEFTRAGAWPAEDPR